MAKVRLQTIYAVEPGSEILNAAKRLGLSCKAHMVYAIGPASNGDLATILAAAKQNNIDCCVIPEEVEV